MDNLNWKFAASIGAVAMAIISNPSFAQETQNDPASGRGTEQSQSGNVIIVTGERTPRTLIDTASSVDVTTQEELDRLPGPDTLSRILEQTANISPTGDENRAPAIRGVDSSGILTSVEGFFGGSQPRTTVQVDGRQLSFNEFVFAGASA